MSHLVANKGGFGIYAPEIPNTSAATLMALRQSGLAIEVEPPGMTQSLLISDIISSELYGTGTEAQNLKIPVNGYFQSSDGVKFVPDELLMDERIPTVLYNGYENSAQAVKDYVAYSEAMRTKWPGQKIAYSFAWNIIPGWSDGSQPPPDGSIANQVLENLLVALCSSGQCPTTAYLDVEWYIDNPNSPSWNAQNLLTILLQTKSILQQHGVGFGILLAGDAGRELSGMTVQLTPDRSSLQSSGPFACSGSSCNSLYQNSELAIMDWLVHQGVIDIQTRVHIQSWYALPAEAGANVSESIPYSLANTADRVFQEALASILTMTPPGNFNVSGTVYYENTSNHYCSFQDPSYLSALGGMLMEPAAPPSRT